MRLLAVAILFASTPALAATSSTWGRQRSTRSAVATTPPGLFS